MISGEIRWNLVMAQMNGTYKFQQFGQDHKKLSSIRYAKIFKTYQYDMWSL